MEQEDITAVRSKILDAYEEKTQKMISDLDLSGNNYLFWDYIQFSLVILMYATGAIPETKLLVKHLLRIYVDGDIETSTVNNEEIVNKIKNELLSKLKK